MRFTVEDVRYDAATHTSQLPDGRPVPHVTAILEAVGVGTDFAELTASSPRLAKLIEFARARGTAVHADTHAHDDDDLDWATVDPLVKPYLSAWITCRADKGLVGLAHGRERRLYHPVQHYTGIMDGIFLLPTRKRILLDLKTGDPESAAAHLQTAAYEAAWTLAHPDEPVDERWAVWLRPDRRIPYTVVNYTAAPDSRADFGKFCACLCVYNEQPERRQRRA